MVNTLDMDIDHVAASRSSSAITFIIASLSGILHSTRSNVCSTHVQQYLRHEA